MSTAAPPDAGTAAAADAGRGGLANLDAALNRAARSAPRFRRTRANAIVLTSMVLAGGIIVVGEASRGELPAPRRLLALGAVYVGLATVATVSPEIAIPASLTVLAAIALVKGEDAAKAIGNVAAGKGQLGSTGRRFRLADLVVKPPPAGLDPNAEAPRSGLPIVQTGTLAPLLPGVATRVGIRVDSGIFAHVNLIVARFNVQVSSGYRSPSQNAGTGGARNSDHLCGMAADFVGPMSNMKALERWAKGQGYAYVDGPEGNSDGNHGDHTHISFRRCR